MPERRPDAAHDAVLASEATHIVITAPPGTGKTFLAVRVAGQVIPSLPDEARVLLLTFSTQARSQLEREASRQLTSRMRARVEITNYHRFFWGAVSAYRRALGLADWLDVGSRQRRETALASLGEDIVARLRDHEGLIDSLAEHAIPHFRDHRTPEDGMLPSLLKVVADEQAVGRLVFDDLGALFWTALDRFPSIDTAYKTRYPIVIADEHQDASSLQDAIVRRLASRRLIIFADPMQLIHEYRGASSSRLEAHQRECDEQYTLSTAHRWHGNQEVAEWLLAVRDNLQRNMRDMAIPPAVSIKRTNVLHGFKGMKAEAKFSALRSFREGCRTVAVLARGNAQVAELRTYFTQGGLRPRQIGSEDFEDARQDIEQLPLLNDPQSIALHAVTRIESLVATIPSRVSAQVRSRINPRGIDFDRARPEVRRILEFLLPIYSVGPGRYFRCVLDAVEYYAGEGHHLPRIEAVRTLRTALHNLREEAPSLEAAVERYSVAVIEAANIAPRLDRGLFVMTVHQAKGKEFDCVILADLSERFWRDDPENRRLFYVALTRASRSWVLIAPTERSSRLLSFLGS